MPFASLSCAAVFLCAVCACQERTQPATPPIDGIEEQAPETQEPFRPGRSMDPADESSRPEPATDVPSPSSAVPERQDDSRMKAAGACLVEDDYACVVRTLEGHAQTEVEFGLLIETYRLVGDFESARKHMAYYVEHFPSGRRADVYRRMLLR